MVQFLSFVFFIVIICFYIKFKNDEKEAERARKYKQDEESRLRTDYPQGYNYYKRYYDQNKYTFHGYGVSERNTDEIVALKSEIIKYQEKINNDIRKAAKEDEDFIVRQDKLNTDSLTIAKKCLRDFGWYFYSIPWEQRTADGSRQDKSLTVWQFFVDNLCLDQDLDYSLIPASKQNFENIGCFKNKTRYWNDFVYDKINSFLTEISKEFHLGILFNQYIANWEKDSLNYHYSKILKNIPNTRVLNEESTRDVIPNDIEYLVIIDCYTENSTLIDNCKYIFKQVHRPCIIYLSLLKCFDRDEMQKWIEEVQKEHEKKELAKKFAEEERLKKEREQREKEERKRNALPSLKLCVSSWETLYNNFPYKFLLHYYPTTCDFEATEDEWNDRWLVWNFKNTPGKTSEKEHEEALDEVIPRLNSLLENTFGNYLDLLTLVCIPASSEANNNARFEGFSKRLTNETDMDNAFDHIQVVKDATPKHLGGTGTPILHFDEDYFKGRYILLFDDVITKGNSMLLFKQKLEALGATVIAGVSVGKTTHERQNQSF